MSLVSSGGSRLLVAIVIGAIAVLVLVAVWGAASAREANERLGQRNRNQAANNDGRVDPFR